jgi:hypothetical protein
MGLCPSSKLTIHVSKNMYRERTVSINVLCINNKKSFSVPDNPSDRV